MGPETVVVVSGGGDVDRRALASLPPAAPVVAADSGVDLALALGLRVDHVVGDLDSVTAEGLAAAVAAGAAVERHPADKDATDLALALVAADRLLGPAAPGHVVVLGGDGGRFDHLLAGVLALADPTWAHRRITAHLGRATVHVVHGGGRAELDRSVPRPSLVTVVPVAGPARGVTTTGLRWALTDATLVPGTTWGVSNEVVGHPATVTLEEGTALVVLPGEEAPR